MAAAPDTLTPYERQTLINQFRILEHLDPDNAHEYREKQKILQRGYSIQYGEVFETWDEKSIDECQYVYDVLNMYRVLKFNYDDLNAEEKAAIKADSLSFRGFDGNHEPGMLGLVEHLRDQGLWTETLGENRDFNSHSILTMHLYPKMLKRYNAIMDKKGVGNNKLTVDEIKEIVA